MLVFMDGICLLKILEQKIRGIWGVVPIGAIVVVMWGNGRLSSFLSLFLKGNITGTGFLNLPDTPVISKQSIPPEASALPHGILLAAVISVITQSITSENFL
jgi:hypothetical protein